MNMSTSSTSSLIVAEQLYSSLGQPLCKTVPVVKQGDNRWGFIMSLVVFRNPLNALTWSTGGPFNPKSDVVQWAWPNNTAITSTDRQYAYQGNFPEADPMQRTTQSAQPGQAFSIQGEPSSTNHSIRYTPGYLPGSVASQLPPLLLGNLDTNALYTQLACNGSTTNLGNVGSIYNASVTDFAGRALASMSIDDEGDYLLSTSFYHIGAEFNSAAAQPYMSETQAYLPNYYASADTAQFITTQTNILGQNIAQTSSDAGTMRNYYDVYGRLRFSQTADQAAAGTVIYYLYDALSRIIESGFLSMAWDISTFQTLTSSPDASQLAVTVNKNALRVWAYDQAPLAVSTQFVFETIGKVMQVTSYNTMLNGTGAVTVNAQSQLTEEYSYDDLGQCTTFAQTLQAGTAYRTSYTYDSLGRIAVLTYPQAVNSTTAFSVYRSYNIQTKLSTLGTSADPVAYASYLYNEFGQVTQENLGSNGQAVNYTYGNTLNQLTAYSDAYQLMNTNLSYTDSKGNYQDGNIQSANYSFNMNIVNVNSTAIQSYSYTYAYDAFNRLTTATALNADGTPNSVWSMSSIQIDANNNLQSYTLNNVANTYTYASGNNQVKKINGGNDFTYSTSGFTRSTPDNLHFTYDLLIPLPTAIDKSGSTVSLIYDARGGRYQKSDGNTTLTYLRGGKANPLVEISTEGTNTATTYYIYGPKGLALINDGATSYVVLKDHLGSVRIVHEDVSSSSMSPAKIAGYFNYLPYGNLMSSNSQQNTNLTCRYLYTGQEWDSELSLYNYHARQYEPSLGRFLTPDPAHQFPSPYVYVGNNPINATDPTGRVEINELVAMLQTGPIFIGETHTNTYALDTIHALLTQNVVTHFSVELVPPAAEYAEIFSEQTLAAGQPMVFRDLGDEEQAYQIIGMLFMQRDFQPRETMRLIQRALQNGKPVYFHDMAAPPNQPHWGTTGEQMAERNKAARGYVTGYLGEGDNQGLVMLAGAAHLDPNQTNNVPLQSLWPDADNRAFDLSAGPATVGGVAVGPGGVVPAAGVAAAEAPAAETAATAERSCCSIL
jgi:RHS repeat-associated protein